MRKTICSIHTAFFLAIFFLIFCFFSSAAFAADLTLAWDSNSESDLSGYKVYYKTGSSGAPYDGTGADQGISGIEISLEELSDPDNPRFTLSGLFENTVYYLAVTAYNEQGSESGYSNEVNHLVEPAINMYTITSSAGPGGSISPAGTTTVSQGSNQAFTITLNAGYHIASVMVDGVSANTETPYTINSVDGSSSEGSLTYTFINITADHTITASFVIDTHIITAIAGAGGSISPAGTTTIAEGSSQACTITPDAGYHVANVTVDGISATVETAYTINSMDGSSSEGNSTYTFSDITADHTISVSFEINTVSYTITATAGAGGSISPAGTTTIAEGSSQVCTITPDAGYHVANVTVDNALVGAVTTYTFNDVATNHVISAGFEINTYTITATGGVNGGISPEGKLTVQNNGNQTFTITPDTDCSIADVLVDGVSIGAVSTYTFTGVIENHFIGASFKMTNQPPRADAGPDQVVDEGVPVTINGANSFDLDDGIESFRWEQTVGTTVVLSTPGDAQCSFLTPDVGPNGEALIFRLSVIDYSGVVSADDCIINVTWINEPPTAHAGPDLNVNEGEIVTLDASQSFDEDDGIGSYQWVQIEGSPVSLSDPTAVSPDFTALDVGPAGAVLNFQLTVTDHGGLQARDTCIVNVCWQNQPPVSDAGVDKEVEGGSLVTLDGTGSVDTDDGISLYRWNQTSGTPVTLSDPTAVSPLFTAPAAGPDGETMNFTLTVADTGGLQHSDACTVTVRSLATDTISPTIQITSPRISGDSYFIKAKMVDLSGIASDNINVSRVTWQNSRGGSGTASGTTQWMVQGLALKGGINTIAVTAEDTAGNRASQTIFIYRLGR